MRDDFFLESSADKNRNKRKRNMKAKESEDSENDGLGGDIDDMNLEADKIESEESDHETAAEKRLRLAKRYLEKVEKEVVDDGEVDAAEIDRDLIAERLQTDVMEASGRIFYQVAEKYKDQTFDNIRTLKCGKTSHQLTVTCLAICTPKTSVIERKQPIYIFSVSKDASIVKWDFFTGKRLGIVHGGLKPTKRIKAMVGVKNLKKHIGHNRELYTCAVSSDGQFLVTGGLDKIIHVWNTQDLSHLGEFKQHRDAISGLSFRKGQNQLYSASFDRCVKLWNIDDLSYIETLFGHQDQITSIDSLTRERCITAGSRDRTVRLWKILEESQLIFRGTQNVVDVVLDGQPEKEKGSVGGSLDVCVMLDEEHFLSGGDNGSISLWSVNKKKPVYTKPRAHLNENPLGCSWITSLAALPFSDLFASASGDGKIKLWKVAESKKSFSLVTQIPMEGIINSMQFVAAAETKQDEQVSSEQSDQALAAKPVTSVSDVSSGARNVSQGSSCLYLVCAVGQEHRFGRWYHEKVKNCIKIIALG